MAYLALTSATGNLIVTTDYESILADAGPDVAINQGETTVLSGSATRGIPPYTWSWSPAETLDDYTLQNPTATPAATTVYTLTVTDSDDKQDSDSVQVNVLVVPLLANAGDDVEIDEEENTVLSGSATGGTPPYAYSWAPADSLDNPSSQTPTATPSATTVYTLTVTDDADVEAEDYVEVAVVPRDDLIHPGTGWTGATEQPAAVGNPDERGYSTMPMARWDFVPYQEFSSTVRPGVVAFHGNGVDYVQFAVEGGEWRQVDSMRNNPDTGASEYWVAIDPTEFSSNELIEVRAVAYPTCGVPRVLESIWLTANPTAGAVRYVDSVNGSDTYDGTSATYVSGTTGPKATIVSAMNSAQGTGGGTYRVDGVNIYLLAGTYAVGPATWPRSYSFYRWINIQPHDGVDRSEVIVGPGSPAGGLFTHLVHIKNCVITYPISSTSAADGPEGPNTYPTRIWVDNCYVTSGSKLTYVHWFPTWINRYVTDTYVTETVYGVETVDMVRNCQFEHMSADPISNPRLVVNSSCYDIDCDEFNAEHPDANLHADTFQFDSLVDRSNCIIYGWTASSIDAQMAICGSGSNRNRREDDIALVDITIDPTGSNPWLSFQWNITTNNMLIKDCDFSYSAGSQFMIFRDNVNTGETATVTNLVIEDSKFYALYFQNTGNDITTDETNVFSGNVYKTGTDWG